MKYRSRIYYTEAQKTLMWERWQKGDSLQKIAQLFDRNHSVVQGILSRTGGIRPVPRSRSRLALTLSEHEEISRGVVAGQSIRSIATRLGRAPSTVSRELSRNGGAEGYRASRADQAAWDRACRPKICKLVANWARAHRVAGKLRMQWSPQQVAGWLKRASPDDESNYVSHETTYRITNGLELTPLSRFLFGFPWSCLMRNIPSATSGPLGKVAARLGSVPGFRRLGGSLTVIVGHPLARTQVFVRREIQSGRPQRLPDVDRGILLEIED